MRKYGYFLRLFFSYFVLFALWWAQVSDLWKANVNTEKPMLFFHFIAFYRWTLRSFYGTGIMELYMHGDMRRRKDTKEGRSLHVQCYHRSPDVATQRPKDEKQ